MARKNEQSAGLVMEYIFVADYFLEDFRGGAEFVNEEVIKILEKNGQCKSSVCSKKQS
jgi:hypothetical protein